MNIAFVGLGTMGLPMVMNLLKAGYAVTAYNRTRSKAQAVVKAGATVADSPQQAAANADIIITCVSDSSDVESVVLGESGVVHGAKPGALVVDMSTISPSVTRRIAQTLADQDIRLIDAPVSGGSEGAEQGTLSIMIGGAAADVEKARPVLAAMGSTVTHVGPIGAGQTTKAINQIIAAGTYWGVAEGIALGLKAGLDMDKVIQAVGSGASASWCLTNRSDNMIHNRYPLGFRVRLHQKDLAIALQTARELNLPLPMAAYVEQIENGLIANGHGDEDLSAIARIVREMGGISEEA